MPFSAIALAIGSALAGALANKGLDKAADSVINKAKIALEKKLKLGKYEAIDKALRGAREDVIEQGETPEQRKIIQQVLDTMLNIETGPLLEEFSSQVTQTYLLPLPDAPAVQSIAKTYRRVSSPKALIKGDVLDEDTLNDLLSAYFFAFRERLLRQEEFTHLREYVQLTETRTQTSLQEAMLSCLDAIAANTAHPVEDYSADERDYRRYLIEELKDHTIRGFSPQVGTRVVSLPLAKIFLPLQAIEGRPALAEYAEKDLLQQALSEASRELDWRNWREEIEKRYTQLSARQSSQRPLTLAELLKSSRAVLLGDPGTGKTTVTRYITYALAADDFTHIDQRAAGLTPVLIRLANYGKALERDSTLHILEYVEHELTDRFGRYLRWAIENGRCLVILDGLDEVADPHLRMQVTDRIQKMVAGFSSNHFLVTSRIVGYDLSPLTREFKHATLKEMTISDQERFVHLWYDAIEGEVEHNSKTPGGDDLVDALKTKPQIGRMAANPLLLTIMVLMHWRGTKLPSRRVQVYQIATDTLLEYWTKQRDVDLDAEDIKPVLAPIAHYILSSNVSGVISKHNLLPRFYKGIAEQGGYGEPEAKRLGRELLRNLNEHSGLFLERGLDANHQPVYGFLHQTFGEYLAALRLAEEMQGGDFDLKKYIHRSMWYEPLLLMAGHLSIYSKPQANKLVHDILEFEAPYEAMLQRNTLLALDVLADDVQLRPNLWRKILTGLVGLLEHEAPQVQEAALERFERLAVTRYRDAAADLLKEHISQFENLDATLLETRLNLAKALLYLGEIDAAQPILGQLEQDAKIQHSGYGNTIQRLRFEYWPTQAADYLLRLQADKSRSFSVSAGIELAECTVGPVNGALAKRILGEHEFISLLKTLLDDVKDKDDRAALRWIMAIAPDSPSPEPFLTLMAADVPAEIRRLAATHLLERAYHSKAVAVLRRLAETETDQAPTALTALLRRDETVQLNWQLLRDTALLSDNDNAPEAIATLFQAGFDDAALPATIHLLATSQPLYQRDFFLRSVMDSLLEYGHLEVGLAAARWLALQPGYRFRYEACAALLEAGQTEATIPLLKFLAYEDHGETGQRAGQRLLALGEAGLVAALFIRVAHLGDSRLRYQASLALALTGHAEEDEAIIPERGDLKAAIFEERHRAYQTAVQNFCQVSIHALDRLEASDDQARAARSLARFSLLWMADLPKAFEQIEQLDELLTSQYSVLCLNAAQFNLKVGRLKKAKGTLLELISGGREKLSSSVRIHTMKVFERFYLPDAVQPLITALNDEDSSVRSAAASALGQLAHPDAVQPLITALSDEDSSVRSAAAQALGQLAHPDAVQPLITALSDENSSVRSAAASALGQLAHPDAVQPLITALSDENSSVRSAAASALGQLAHPDAVQPLITALSDEDSRVRSTAASALGQLAHPDAVQPLITALSDEDSSVRFAAAQALGQLAHPDTVQPLITALSDDDIIVRFAATSALEELAHPDTVQLLITALNDEDSSVRSAAASALGQLAHPAAVQPLITALSHEDIIVRFAAAQALGQLAHPAAVQPLITALSHEDSSVRSAAARALEELAHPDTVQPLITALNDEDSSVRSVAARALGQLVHPDIVQPLIIALSDEDIIVRFAATKALGQLAHPAAVQPLITALSHENPFIRSTAASALEELAHPAAVQPLITALSDEDSSVRSTAASALGQIGAAEAVPIIVATSVVNDIYNHVVALIHLNPEHALPVLERYTRQFKHKYWGEQLRGQALWQLGDMDGALVALQEAAGQEANSSNLLALAHFHLEQAELSTARRYVEQAIEKAGQYGQSRCLLSQAVIMWLSGKQSLALDVLVQAQQKGRYVANVKALKYSHFWREKAIATLETMLAKQQSL